MEVFCVEPIKGRFVSIWKMTILGSLNLCEVEVYGKKGEIRHKI